MLQSDLLTSYPDAIFYFFIFLFEPGQELLCLNQRFSYFVLGESLHVKNILIRDQLKTEGKGNRRDWKHMHIKYTCCFRRLLCGPQFENPWFNKNSLLLCTGLSSSLLAACLSDRLSPPRAIPLNNSPVGLRCLPACQEIVSEWASRPAPGVCTEECGQCSVYGEHGDGTVLYPLQPQWVGIWLDLCSKWVNIWVLGYCETHVLWDNKW